MSGCVADAVADYRDPGASSTLNRLELSRPDETSTNRYKKVMADYRALDRLLVNLFLESHGEPPREIVVVLVVSGLGAPVRTQSCLPWAQRSGGGAHL